MGLPISFHVENALFVNMDMVRAAGFDETFADSWDTFRACLRRFIPKADGPLLAMRTCIYTNSPDSHFILGRHPRHERALIACGFSGSAFVARQSPSCRSTTKEQVR